MEEKHRELRRLVAVALRMPELEAAVGFGRPREVGATAAAADGH